MGSAPYEPTVPRPAAVPSVPFNYNKYTITLKLEWNDLDEGLKRSHRDGRHQEVKLFSNHVEVAPCLLEVHVGFLCTLSDIVSDSLRLTLRVFFLVGVHLNRTLQLWIRSP